MGSPGKADGQEDAPLEGTAAEGPDCPGDFPTTKSSEPTGHLRPHHEQDFPPRAGCRAARSELAEELNVHVGGDGTAEENIALHRAVMQKLADNGGKVPDSLKGQ